MLKWLILPVKRLTDFKGRSRRREFWPFSIALVVLWGALYLLATRLFPLAEGTLGTPLLDITPPLSDGAHSALLFVGGPLFLFFGWVHLALSIRRLHDTGRSGWWWLVTVIPYIGTIIALVWYSQDSQPFETRYGEDPKGREPDLPPVSGPYSRDVPLPAARVRKD